MVDFGWPFLFVVAVFLLPILFAAGILVLLLFGSVTAGRILRQTTASEPFDKAEFCGWYNGVPDGVSLIVTARRLRHPFGAPGGGILVLRETEDGDERVNPWNKSQHGN